MNLHQRKWRADISKQSRQRSQYLDECAAKQVQEDHRCADDQVMLENHLPLTFIPGIDIHLAKELLDIQRGVLAKHLCLLQYRSHIVRAQSCNLLWEQRARWDTTSTFPSASVLVCIFTCSHCPDHRTCRLWNDLLHQLSLGSQEKHDFVCPLAGLILKELLHQHDRDEGLPSS